MATVPSGHMRQAGALAAHWVTGSQLTDHARWVTAAGCKQEQKRVLGDHTDQPSNLWGSRRGREDGGPQG